MRKIMVGLMIIMLVGMVAAGCNVHSKWVKLKVTYPGGSKYIYLYDGKDDVEWVVYDYYGHPWRWRLAIQLDDVNVETDSNCNVIDESVNIKFTILNTNHFDDLYTHEILGVGRKIYVGDKYSLRLTDVGAEEMHPALFEVVDERVGEIDGSYVYSAFRRMFPGDEKEFYYYKYEPKVYKVVVNQTSYGYELFQRWAEVKVYSADPRYCFQQSWTGREGDRTEVNGVIVEVVGIYETVERENECVRRRPYIDVEEEEKEVRPGDSFYYHFTIENRDQYCDPSDLRVRITDYDGCLDFDWYSKEYTLDSGEDKHKRVKVENVRSCSSGTHRVKFEACANGYCDHDYVYYTIKPVCSRSTSYGAIEYPRERPLIFHDYTDKWIWVLDITNEDYGECDDNTYTITVEPTGDTVRHFNFSPRVYHLSLSKGEHGCFKLNITKNEDNPPLNGTKYYAKIRIEDSEGNVKYFDMFIRYESSTQPAQPTHTLNFKIYKGWNIIPFIQGMNVSTNCGLKPYAYVYDPFYNQYIRVSTDRSARNYYNSDEIDTRYGPLKDMRYRVAYSGAWVYSPEDCEMNVSYDYEPTEDDEPLLVKGWNFLQVADWMTGKWLSQVKGSCTFDKIYAWDPILQQWEGPAPQDFYIDDDKHGEVLIVYTTGECRLFRTSGGDEQPPTLP